MPSMTGLDEPDNTDRNDAEVTIRITVPQDLAGWSMGEISIRRGVITGMDLDGENAIVRARVPNSQYMALSNAIAKGTGGRAKLEHDPPS